MQLGAVRFQGCGQGLCQRLPWVPWVPGEAGTSTTVKELAPESFAST